MQLNEPTLNQYPDDDPPRYSVRETSTLYMSGAGVWHVYRIGQPGIVDHIICDPKTAATVERLLNAEASRAAKLAAGLALMVDDLHPVYGPEDDDGDPIPWCQVISPTDPDTDTLGQQLDAPLHEYARYHTRFDLDAAKERLRKELA